MTEGEATPDGVQSPASPPVSRIASLRSSFKRWTKTPLGRLITDFPIEIRMRRLARIQRRLDGMIERPEVSAPWPASQDQDWLIPHAMKSHFAAIDEPTPSYLARRRICEDEGYRLQPKDEARCRRLAEKLGVPLDKPLVILHVRGHGFKQDPVNRDSEGKILKRAEYTRNADITTYFEAVDYLVQRGFYIIRTGDSSMPPVEREGVFDLALCPQRTGMLELFFLSVSRFMIASESGPYHVAYMFGLPTLLINGTDVIGSYPIRPLDRYIFKRVRNLETGEFLTMDELVGERHYTLFRNTDYWEYIDNTPTEIFRAVKEMLRVLEGETQPTKLQIKFRDHAVDSAWELAKKIYYVRKWGADQKFLGHGYICHTFAETLWAAEEDAESPSSLVAKPQPVAAQAAPSIHGA